MDWLLLSFGKFVPVAFSLLGLWIKAFDSTGRITKAGKFILPGLVASAVLVYSVDQLDKALSRLASEHEKQEAVFQQIATLDSVKPSDIVVTLRGTSESVAIKKHPKFLQRDWELSLLVNGRSLVGTAVAGHTSQEEANDEEEGTLFLESRTFSHFAGDFGEFIRADAWNGVRLGMSLEADKSAIPTGLDDWILKDKDQDFAWKSKATIDELSKPDETDTDKIGEWRMLPMPISVEIMVKGRLIMRTSGYVVYSRYPDDSTGTVEPLFSSHALVPKIFPIREDFVRPPKKADLDFCVLMRVIAYLSLFIAAVSTAGAIRVQFSVRNANSLAAAPAAN